MPRHEETRTLPYTAQQMYDLVADVARYPEFLPWCAAARITSETQQEGGRLMTADLVVSFKVFREKFASQVELADEALQIDTRYLDGPFKHMHSKWGFKDAADGGCEVTFFVDFEFKNRVLQGVIGVVFNEAMMVIVRAFESRAKTLYEGSSTA